MRIYKTKYNSFINLLTGFVQQLFVGPWKLRSLSLISLLLGFYIVSTFISYFIDALNQRIILSLVIYAFIELCIRYRHLIALLKNKLILIFIDNLRIGITYAIVLEAFKLGS